VPEGSLSHLSGKRFAAPIVLQPHLSSAPKPIGGLQWITTCGLPTHQRIEAVGCANGRIDSLLAFLQHSLDLLLGA
jgi:hypothetical protein